MSTDSGSSVLRKGQVKDVTSQLKTTRGLVPTVINFIPESTPAVLVKFHPQSINYSRNLEPSPFEFYVSPGAQNGQYIIPVKANISITDAFPSSFFHLDYELPVHGYIMREANLTISVKDPLSFQEQFKDFWDTFGQPISIVAGGFAGGIASLLFDRLKKPKEDVNLDDYKNI